jgi:hypothetical protein
LRLSRIDVSLLGELAVRDAEYLRFQHAEEAAFVWNGIEPLGEQTLSVSSGFLTGGLTNDCGYGAAGHHKERIKTLTHCAAVVLPLHL